MLKFGENLWAKKREASEEKKVPFCQEIRDFIDKSRTHQTYYASHEGYFDERIFNRNYDDDLKIFIHNTLFESEDESSDSQNLRNLIFKKIISLKTAYFSSGEIHLAVIWIYYFVYGNKEIKSTPLFKVFISEEQAIFITVEGISFSSWDDYLDNCLLPNSLLCVPQHGVYNYKDNPYLKLNYFNSFNGGKAEWVHKPYSQRVIYPLMQSLHLMNDKLKKEVEQIRNFLQNNGKTCITIGTVTFFLICFIKKYEISKNYLKDLKLNLLMLQNKILNYSESEEMLHIIPKLLMELNYENIEVLNQLLEPFFELYKLIKSSIGIIRSGDKITHKIKLILEQLLNYMEILGDSQILRFLGQYCPNFKPVISILIIYCNIKNKIFPAQINSENGHSELNNSDEIANNLSLPEETLEYLEDHCTEYCNKEDGKKFYFLGVILENGQHLYYFNETNIDEISPSLFALHGNNCFLVAVGEQQHSVFDNISLQKIGEIATLGDNFFLGIFLKDAIQNHSGCC